MGWDTGLGEWVGVSIVTSEFVTRPGKKKKKSRHERYTHILHGCFSLKAVDFSVATKKKRLLQTNHQRFSSFCTRTFHFQPHTLCFQLYRFFSTGSFFFNLGDFSNLKEWETEAYFSAL